MNRVNWMKCLSLWPGMIIGAVLSLVLMDGLSALSPAAQKTVVFDKGYAISAFAKELERRRLSEKQGQVLTQRFVWAMNNTLKEQSLKNSWVIVPQTSVYAGVSDKTEVMLKLIAQKMKKESAKRDLSRKLQRSAS
ncbi:hypothetical protein FOG18_13770 (plasmid) [Legionella israelensis]|uniref:TrbI F-type domain-containing protein n=1 Tax=Legionella israelensis TaxID=454 RepID=UPI001180F279|nr:TrbI F-type domain-containing protein [Legionella israelensis]QDP73721.1 hypothetical protein FOG18_13770 [Legionella israelensis]